MTGIAHHPALTVLARIAQALPRKLLGQRAACSFPVLDPHEFHEVFGNALPELQDARLAHFLELPVDRAPWYDTGVEVYEGDWLSWFANGELVVSGLLDIRFGADFQLWARIGEDGSVFRGSRNSHTFRASRAGRLYLASLHPGVWATQQGELANGIKGYARARGTLALWLLHWNREPTGDLLRLREVCDPAYLVSGEIDRRAGMNAAPAGWSSLWALGDAETWRQGEDGCIACRTRADVQIVQRDVELELRPGTRLAWDWRVDALPSRFAEHTLATHDYMSIAVEFDNGIDMTWYWSAKLPPGYGYWCPLPTWGEREFHVVVRSGSERFGQWLNESRDLHADYRRYIGTPPARIVRVWLIGVSLFQRHVGSCDFRGIRLEQGEKIVRL